MSPPIPLEDLPSSTSSPPSYHSRSSSLTTSSNVILPLHDVELCTRRPKPTTSSPSSLLSSRTRLSTRTRILVIVTCTLSFIIVFRRHLLALTLIVNCYITWPFSPPPLLKVDIPSLPVSSSVGFIPRNLHHVLLGPLGRNPPEDWLAARNSCVTLHENWSQHYFWTDNNADDFFEQHYPWFVDTWNSYPSIVQRADALRYFVLHKFGGVFLDMDLFCRTPLDAFMSYLETQTPFQHRRPAQGGMYILAESGHQHILLAPKANPVGVSNGFIISTKGHPLLSQMITFLPRFNLNFILSYATVMFSTGCMYISSHMQLFARRNWARNTLFVLDGTENMLNGNVDTPLFHHLGTSSWHSSDAKIIRKIVGSVRGTSNLTIFFVLMGILVICVLVRRRGTRTVQGGFRRLLRRVSSHHYTEDA